MVMASPNWTKLQSFDAQDGPFCLSRCKMAVIVMVKVTHRLHWPQSTQPTHIPCLSDFTKHLATMVTYFLAFAVCWSMGADSNSPSSLLPSPTFSNRWILFLNSALLDLLPVPPAEPLAAVLAGPEVLPSGAPEAISWSWSCCLKSLTDTPTGV